MVYSTPSPGGNTWNFERAFFLPELTKPQLVTYMESHDEEGWPTRTSISAIPSAAIPPVTAHQCGQAGTLRFVFIEHPGPKMIWQFGELGYDYSINHCTKWYGQQQPRWLDKQTDPLGLPQPGPAAGLFNIYRAMAVSGQIPDTEMCLWPTISPLTGILLVVSNG